MKTEYQVVKSINLDYLIEQVNRLLKEGWQAQGGVCAVTKGICECYLQALIRVTYAPYTVNTYTVSAQEQSVVQLETV